MPPELTTEKVWREVGKQHFAVLGTVSRKGQPRTAGVVYTVQGKELYVGTFRYSLKVKHIEGNPRVSLTVLIPKRIPFMPFLKIPPASILFSGEASIHGPGEIPSGIHKALIGGLKGLSAEAKAQTCYLKIRPNGEFVTYGVGVPMRTMLNPERATARVPV
ncbi:MAG: pyridoxamine 5'-phosphate oxidase family protein [Nitrospinota bacterium]